MNRLLGASEHFLWLRDQGWSVNFAMTACITGSLTIQHFTDALAWLQRRHPLLRVRITIDEQKQPRFFSESVPAIPLRVVKRQGEHHWSQEVAEEVVKPFSWSEEPLLRVVFLQGDDVSELIFICHHSIGDALSVVYLIRDFLQELGTPGSARQILPELPPLEELIPSSVYRKNGDAGGENVLSQKIAESSSKVDFPSASAREATLGKWRPSFLYWSLSAEEATRLISCCREEQVSVHGALCASFLLSIANEVSSPNETVLKCLSPLNVRSYLVPPVGSDMGVYISLPVTSHKLQPKSNFWEVAREVKHQINEVVAQGKMFSGIPKLRAFLSTQPDPNAVYQQVLKRGDDLAVSNLGRLDMPQQFGHLRLQAIYGPTLLGSENVRVVSVTTLGDKMFFTFAYLESLTPQAIAEKIKAGAMQRIREAVSQSKLQTTSI